MTLVTGSDERISFGTRGAFEKMTVQKQYILSHTRKRAPYIQMAMLCLSKVSVCYSNDEKEKDDFGVTVVTATHSVRHVTLRL